MGASSSDWVCEAYGPEGVEVGAVCFFGPNPHGRDCTTEQQCRTRLTAERQRVFARINEMAAQGDPVGLDLAAEITHPEQLLGGTASND